MDEIKLEMDPPCAVIVLNRPHVRNALSPGLFEAFRQALADIEPRSDIAGVIVTGEGTAFSAGADLNILKHVTALSTEESRQDSLQFMDFFRGLSNFPKPVIAAVNGPAIGGGCGLATACDIVLAVEEAVFAYTEVKVGFVPALVSFFLLRTCGDKRARELLLTARPFTAAEAREYGLVNQIVPADELIPKAKEMVRLIAGNSPVAVRLAKGLIRDLQALSLDQALASAVHVNALVRNTEDFKEGITSFLEKRSPIWKKS
jgi:methylglutaconyl-CoA hydratase